jgi:hypothetical protein
MNERKVAAFDVWRVAEAIEERPLLNTRDAARFLGIQIGTVRFWRRRKSGQSGPAYTRLGGVVRYSLKDLRGYLESRRVPEKK